MSSLSDNCKWFDVNKKAYFKEKSFLLLAIGPGKKKFT